MAQYDILLTQNVAAAGIEFTERYVNLPKGTILSGNASGVPTVLPSGSNGYMLVRDDAEATGLKWVAISAGHTQGTDLGTTSTTFELDSDGFKVELTAESATKFGVKQDGGTLYADLQAKDIIAASIALTTGTISTAPSTGNDIVNKTYADGLIAANDAMVFKGTVGAGGTLEIAAFNSLATYNAGWTYRVITAGTIKGKVCEVGDLIVAMVDRTGTGNVDADWTVIQANLDGAVTSTAGTVTDSQIVVWDGTSGKIVKNSGTSLSAYVDKALFDANTILYATTDNTPVALTVGASTIVGRGAAGNITALTPAQAMNVLWVAAPATKTSTGTAGQIAKDDNWFYICTATNIWKRSPIATNW
jgi:hypothetical protein